MNYRRTDVAKAFIIEADKNMDRAIKQLASLILEERMHSQVEDILNDISTQYRLQKGYVEADVISAFKLGEKLKRQLELRIKSETGAKNVNLNETLDSSLLAGVIVSAPGMELDLSLKSKLAKLRAWNELGYEIRNNK